MAIIYGVTISSIHLLVSSSINLLGGPQFLFGLPEELTG